MTSRATRGGSGHPTPSTNQPPPARRPAPERSLARVFLQTPASSPARRRPLCALVVGKLPENFGGRRGKVLVVSLFGFRLFGSIVRSSVSTMWGGENAQSYGRCVFFRFVFVLRLCEVFGGPRSCWRLFCFVVSVWFLFVFTYYLFYYDYRNRNDENSKTIMLLRQFFWDIDYVSFLFGNVFWRCKIIVDVVTLDVQKIKGNFTLIFLLIVFF